jgi:hypothetical protein
LALKPPTVIFTSQLPIFWLIETGEPTNSAKRTVQFIAVFGLFEICGCSFGRCSVNWTTE